MVSLPEELVEEVRGRVVDMTRGRGEVRRLD
jgi:hypothetical protein